jgi:hypothetical protein
MHQAHSHWPANSFVLGGRWHARNKLILMGEQENTKMEKQEEEAQTARYIIVVVLRI